MSDPVEAILAVECPTHKHRGKNRGCWDWDSMVIAVCLARIRAALSPEAPKPRRWNSHAFCAEKGVCLAKPEDPSSMHGEMCQDMTAALGPKPAEAATCRPWCGREMACGNDPRCHVSRALCWCTEACQLAGRPLHPATEQAATCGTCGGTKREVFMFSHGQTIDEPCPDCGGTGRR